MTRHCLYRHFDANGRLLYVGRSLSPAHRLQQHANGSPWFPDICRVEQEWFDSLEAVMAAERKAIIAELPLHNRIFNPLRKPPVGQRKQPPELHRLNRTAIRKAQESLWGNLTGQVILYDRDHPNFGVHITHAKVTYFYRHKAPYREREYILLQPDPNTPEGARLAAKVIMKHLCKDPYSVPGRRIQVDEGKARTRRRLAAPESLTA